MAHKILVVEDDDAFCYAVAKALEQAGYEVETHAGSTEAWPFVGAKARFDLLLADVMFPRGQPTGFALARSAHYHHPRRPVIYMSAYPSAVDVAKADGAVVFTKPIDLDELIRKIGDMLTPSTPGQP